MRAVWLINYFLHVRSEESDDVLDKMKTRIPSLRPAMRGSYCISSLKCASFLHAVEHADPIVKLEEPGKCRICRPRRPRAGKQQN